MLKNKLCSMTFMIVSAVLIPLLVQGTNVFAWQFAAVGDIECNDTGKKVGEGMKADRCRLSHIIG